MYRVIGVLRNVRNASRRGYDAVVSICDIDLRKESPFEASGPASRCSLSTKGTITTNPISYWSQLEAELCRGKNLAERDAREWQMPQHLRTARGRLKDKPTASVLSDSSNLLDVSTHQEFAQFALESQEANDVQGFLNYPIPQKMSNPTTLPRSDKDPDASDAVFIPNSPDLFTFDPTHDVSTLSHSEKGHSSGGTDSSQGRLTQSSNFTNPTIRLLYEPLPDNLSCWERGLLSNCTLCIPQFPYLNQS